MCGSWGTTKLSMEVLSFSNHIASLHNKIRSPPYWCVVLFKFNGQCRKNNTFFLIFSMVWASANWFWKHMWTFVHWQDLDTWVWWWRYRSFPLKWTLCSLLHVQFLKSRRECVVGRFGCTVSVRAKWQLEVVLAWKVRGVRELFHVLGH